MSNSENDGWNESAASWIASMGESGDFSRQFVLDAPMLARIKNRGFKSALDVGCGEGRFCRMLRDLEITTVGIDPTAALIARARERDPAGDYRVCTAEEMDVLPASFDLVVSYLTLIDITDIAHAAERCVAALRPGGTLLVANLTSFATANVNGWTTQADGRHRFHIDNYLDERAEWVEWRGIRIRNWHRPLSRYMSLFLDLGLILRRFEEPAPTGGDPEIVSRYRRVPYLYLMEWQKPPV
ncbi:class I SAM-dependent methyltransferase [Hyphomicrobium sp.]|jgi:SAM-dependent methyltransferase|uniref:class I SAM-dependent methyltransferase n=1 Tax=Hyphomicrobium sp. TaxID=82 RepID=UPI002D0A7319|nr:class I SAM-dependent methyltransferase [Hyphomicrobium sp.]HVZ05217.1 class I SAM-dependent methyltransferase [Hyphomicrobium sp.]